MTTRAATRLLSPRLLGSLVLVGFLAWRMDWRQLGEAFARLDLRLWAAAVTVFVGCQLVSSLRWQMLAAPLGIHGGYPRYVALYFIGMFFNLVLPTSVGGDVVRAWYLSRQGTGPGAPPRRAAAFLSVLAERGSGLAMLVLLACVAGLVVPVPLPRWMATVLVVLGAASLAGLACLPFLGWLERLPLIGRKMGTVVAGLRTYLGRPGLLAVAALLSVVVQVGGVVQVWLIGVGLGLDVPLTYYAVIVPLVTLMTLAPVSVNGMGLRELGLVVLLAPLGVTAAPAVTLSLLLFALTVLTSLAGAGFYLAGSYPRFSAELARRSSAGDERPEEASDADAIGGGPDQGREGQPAAAA